MDFPPRDKTDERCLESGGFEINEMLQTPHNADYQFLKIVVVRLIGSGGDFCYISLGDWEYLKWLVQCFFYDCTQQPCVELTQ